MQAMLLQEYSQSTEVGPTCILERLIFFMETLIMFFQNVSYYS